MSSSVTFDQTPTRAAAPVVRRPDASAPTRLTRRGRLVIVAVIAVLLLVAVIAGAASVSAATSSSASGAPATVSVVVQPGQTLWQIAESVAPQRDPRDTIQQIVDLNDLASPLVAPGQSLVVPA